MVSVWVCVHSYAHNKCNLAPVPMACGEKRPINRSEIVGAESRHCTEFLGV